MGFLFSGGIWILIGDGILILSLSGPLRNEICMILTSLGAGMILLSIVVGRVFDRLRINRMGTLWRTKTFDEDWDWPRSKLWKSEVIDYRGANGSLQQNQLQAAQIRAANEAFGGSQRL